MLARLWCYQASTATGTTCVRSLTRWSIVTTVSQICNPVTKYEQVFMFLRVMTNLMVLAADVCKGMLHNEDLLYTLRESHYDQGRIIHWALWARAQGPKRGEELFFLKCLYTKCK